MAMIVASSLRLRTCCARLRRRRSVMGNRSVRSRRMIAGVIVSILVVVVLVLAGSAQAQDSPRIGLKIRTLTAELRKQWNLPDNVKGALVTGVTAGSPTQE